MTDLKHSLAWMNLKNLTCGEILNLYEELFWCRHYLLNLLAVIHGDGGHYTDEHGLKKAAKDAEKVISDLLHRKNKSND